MAFQGPHDKMVENPTGTPMKLMRHGPQGQEKPGLVDAQGALRDLSAHVADISSATLNPDTLARLAALESERARLRREEEEAIMTVAAMLPREGRRWQSIEKCTRCVQGIARYQI